MKGPCRNGGFPSHERRLVQCHLMVYTTHKKGDLGYGLSLGSYSTTDLYNHYMQKVQTCKYILQSGWYPKFFRITPLSLQTAVHPAPCASQRAIWRGHHSPRRVGPARNLYPCRCLNVGGKHGTWVSFPLVLGHLHGENDDFYIFLPWDFDIYACSDPHQDTHLGFLRIFGWSILRAWPWVPWCPWCRCLSLAPRPP